MCNGAITVSSFLFVRGQNIQSFNTGNILYNLFSGNSSYSDCHVYITSPSGCATHRKGDVMCLCYTPRRGCYVLVLHTEKVRLCTCATHRVVDVMYLCYTPRRGCYVLVLHTEKARLCTCATHRVVDVMFLCYTPRRGGFIFISS